MEERRIRLGRTMMFMVGGDKQAKAESSVDATPLLFLSL
jgi:hypothetical protein